MSRTVVIGDVHGCYDELLELLDKCQVTSSDRVISLGDMVDRGPKVREVCDYFMTQEAILGNHEERMMKYFVEWQKKGSPMNPDTISGALRFRADYHRDSFLSLGPQHYEWFKSLPKFMRLPDLAPDGLPVTLIHAGCVPQVPLEEQDDFLLMHISNVIPPDVGSLSDRGLKHGYWTGHEASFWTSKAPPEAPFWASIYDGSLGHVVFGHSGFTKVAQFPHATGIDLGCCFGRELCALILPEWCFVTVPAHATYKASTRIRVFEVYPGIEVFS